MLQVLLCAIIKHGEAKRDFEFIGADKDRQLESRWRETKIGDFLPFREDVADEAERLLAISKANRAATQRRPGSGVVDESQQCPVCWNSNARQIKRRDYKERG